MKKIIISLSIIGAVAAIVVGATTAFFSDEETGTATLTAGVVDIVVNDSNPWSTGGTFTLDDMKPSYTKYIAFTVRNLVNSNPIDLWKQVHITSQTDGTVSEPECTEGNGTWSNNQCGGSYVPRNNLAAYTLYDMYVCVPIASACATDPNNSAPVDIDEWTPIITEAQNVRLDNVDGAWISLGQMQPDKQLKVVQSYHLSSWPGAPESEVTNWAQGDVMTFDINLMATQLNAPGPAGAQASLTLENKDPISFQPILNDGISGTLTYNTSGPSFNYSFTGTVPQVNTSYCLIYYADPWPGDGKNHLTGMDIACETSIGNTLTLSGNPDIATDLPNSDDQNYPGGAKLWIVSDDDYDNTNDNMTAWNPANYLFEMQFIIYDDTDIP